MKASRKDKKICGDWGATCDTEVHNALPFSPVLTPLQILGRALPVEGMASSDNSCEVAQLSSVGEPAVRVVQIAGGRQQMTIMQRALERDSRKYNEKVKQVTRCSYARLLSRLFLVQRKQGSAKCTNPIQTALDNEFRAMMIQRRGPQHGRKPKTPCLPSHIIGGGGGVLKATR